MNDNEKDLRQNNGDTEQSDGVIFSLCDKIGEVAENGFLSKVATAYSKEEELLSNSAVSQIIKRSGEGHGVFRKFKKIVASRFESSLFMSFFGMIKNNMLRCKIKTYGLFFITFGIYSALIYLIKKYAFFNDNTDFFNFVCSLAVIFVAIPSLFSKKTFGEALLGSSVTRIIVDYLGIPQERLFIKDNDASSLSQSPAVIFGILFGMLTYFVSPVVMLNVFISSLFYILLFVFPESGVAIGITVAPFLSFFKKPSFTLGLITTISFLGYIVKNWRGKRTIRFGPSEAAVLFFSMLTLAGGLFLPVNSTAFDPRPAILRTCLILIYFLMVNSITNRKRLSLCAVLYVSSATVVSFAGVAEYLLGGATYNWLDVSLFSEISGRSTAVFSNPNFLAFYIIIAFPLALAMLFLSKSRKTRFLSGFSVLSMLVCCIFTWSRGAWLGLALSACVFLIIVSPRFLSLVPGFTLLTTTACMLFPKTFGKRLEHLFSLADSANYYRVRIWNGVCSLIEKYPIGGIGSEKNGFGNSYLQFASSYVWTAPHAHSLWLQILTELGIPGIVIFVFASFLIAQKALECTVRSHDDELKILSAAGMCAMLSLLIAGFFDYTWYNYTVFYYFWVACGFASAAAGIYRTEFSERRNTLFSAYSDEKTSDVTIIIE